MQRALISHPKALWPVNLVGFFTPFLNMSRQNWFYMTPVFTRTKLISERTGIQFSTESKFWTRDDYQEAYKSISDAPVFLPKVFHKYWHERCAMSQRLVVASSFNISQDTSASAMIGARQGFTSAMGLSDDFARTDVVMIGQRVAVSPYAYETIGKEFCLKEMDGKT